MCVCWCEILPCGKGSLTLEKHSATHSHNASRVTHSLIICHTFLQSKTTKRKTKRQEKQQRLAHFLSCACVVFWLCSLLSDNVDVAASADAAAAAAAAAAFVFVCVRFSAHLSSSWVNTNTSTQGKAPRLHNTAARRDQSAPSRSLPRTSTLSLSRAGFSLQHCAARFGYFNSVLGSTSPVIGILKDVI